MVRTYQGYFQEDGCFVSDRAPVKLPTRRRAIVNIFDDELAGNDEPSQVENTLSDRIDRIRLMLASALEIEDEALSDDDWDEMQNLRSQTNAGMSRVVDL